MKNLKEAERAAAEGDGSDVEGQHLTISRQDVYDQVKKGSILNDKIRSGKGSSNPELMNGRKDNLDSHLNLRSAERVRKTKGKDERRLRRSPRSPIKSDDLSVKRRAAGRSSLNGDATILSPRVRCRPSRNRK